VEGRHTQLSRRPFKFLQRAEATYRDIQVALERAAEVGGGGGGGGGARDLAAPFSISSSIPRRINTRPSRARLRPSSKSSR